ncbi:Fic family protein [Endozoicomonas sp. SCSIO W0465]|uniref:Fic family protein n=1 Tax=Endozoicomonas sp. SCSIO W0465 TaxID=2918516 RepID=UPI0020757D1A|nr:Fic family protein [Endozoicomonas sp. SCSIO W0465]USE36178.1 Fic family protein [Endozoicomonas sp. SCSIO W0465]
MYTLEHLSGYAFSSYQLGLFRQLGEFRGRQLVTARQQPEVLDTLRQVAVLESVEFSSRLDGLFSAHSAQIASRKAASRELVRKLVHKEYRPATPVERQVAGYRDGLEMVVEPGEHMTLSVSLIRQLHAMLYAHLPHEGGRWRVTNKEIVERDSKGQRIGVLYRTIPATAIAGAMEKLVAYYHEGLQQQDEPLLLIAAVVLDFLCIHPFSDGNARIAWLLMAMMLALNGYQVVQLISLERVLLRHEQDYKRALQLSVKGWQEGQHNPMPWIDFFLNTLIRAYDELEDKIQTLQWQGSRAPKSQLVRMAIEQTRHTFSIADICLQIPTVSRELVKKVVQQMRAEGLLEPVGRGRGAQWQKCNRSVIRN